ncbi:hypothetical protein [Companilactobacillus nantensis]|uniref:Surface layer protein A domain-containing protein n=1 Tax=Companilactobacillus nantensis DSM 16982 TaxID=1423774 RepID=A0A0R1WJ88_9LACO|nr:hypothetical protein [Companilactobacillus nantensis]KRM17823.1 hypothetical protein FD31_GL002343 [Companilactobacillus nantensis DSM 16982]GEO63523.1 hypothetical protein LNA01_07060 [Companilactobacillus nantensis]
MRKSTIGSLIIAGFAAVSIGAFSNITNVSAAGITTTRSNIVRIYNPQGNLVTNRALGPHTAWKVGETKIINNEKMYQVATYEYVKASETDYDGPATSVVTKDDLYGTWISDRSDLRFFVDTFANDIGNDTYGYYYSVANISGNQVTITYKEYGNSVNRSGSTTYTLNGNSLESNTTHEIWYKQN